MSYDPAEPTERDQVRGKTGDWDADEDNEVLDDDTIDAILTRYPSVVAASIECTKRLIAHYAKDPDSRSAVGMSTSQSRVDRLRTLLDELKMELASEAEMHFGGLSVGEVEAIESDTDFEQPQFKIGAFDNTT